MGSRLVILVAMVAQQKRNVAKAVVVAGAMGAVVLKNYAFVPAPKASHAPVAAAVSAATLGAAPAFADPIGDAAAKLSDAAYPFVKDVDWQTSLYMQNPSGASSADWL